MVLKKLRKPVSRKRHQLVAEPGGTKLPRFLKKGTTQVGAPAARDSHDGGKGKTSGHRTCAQRAKPKASLEIFPGPIAGRGRNIFPKFKRLKTSGRHVADGGYSRLAPKKAGPPGKKSPNSTAAALRLSISRELHTVYPSVFFRREGKESYSDISIAHAQRSRAGTTCSQTKKPKSNSRDTAALMLQIIKSCIELEFRGGGRRRGSNSLSRNDAPARGVSGPVPRTLAREETNTRQRNRMNSVLAASKVCDGKAGRRPHNKEESAGRGSRSPEQFGFPGRGQRDRDQGVAKKGSVDR